VTSAPTVAVGAVLFRPDGRVLVVQRGHAPRAGTWTLPGGRVHKGELLRDALRREIREETKLEIDVGPLVEVVEILDGDFHYVVLDFLCALRSPPDEAVASDDAADLRWVTDEELTELGVTADVLRVVREGARLARQP